jgi:hypothetical protein
MARFATCPTRPQLLHVLLNGIVKFLQKKNQKKNSGHHHSSYLIFFLLLLGFRLFLGAFVLFSFWFRLGVLFLFIRISVVELTVIVVIIIIRTVTRGFLL